MPIRPVNRKPVSKKSGFGLLEVFVLALVGWMAARTFSRGDDFRVFYETARGFYFGFSPYDLETYGNMVFKYPPWWLPLFFPFAALPYLIAKGFFVVLQGAALWSISRNLQHIYRIEKAILIAVFVAFIPLLLIQAMIGQLSIFFVSISLFWLAQPSATTGGTMFLLLSSKLVTVFPLVSRFGEWKFWREAVLSGLVFLLLSVPLLLLYHGDVSALLFDWKRAMFSGTAVKDSVQIGFMTREAQGIPSLLLKAFRWDETQSANVAIATGIGFVGAAVIAFVATWRRERQVSFAVWLAMTPLALPLAWFHSYLMALPLFAIELKRARDSRSVGRSIIVLISILALVAITEKTLGEFGLRLEHLGIKSMGVLLLVILFWSASLKDPGK